MYCINVLLGLFEASPDTITYNSCIGACGKALEWQLALKILAGAMRNSFRGAFSDRFLLEKNVYK